LINALGPDGKFVYVYSPETNSVPGKYNIVRHCGTIYAMLELYEITGNKELLQAAERAIGYLLRSIQPCSIKKVNGACVVERRYTNLGAKRSCSSRVSQVHRDHSRPTIHASSANLGRWIKSAQSGNGKFAILKQSYPKGKVVNIDLPIIRAKHCWL